MRRGTTLALVGLMVLAGCDEGSDGAPNTPADGAGGKADDTNGGERVTPVAVTMTQIEELDGELDSVEPEVVAFSNADVVVPEAYLRPMAALGYYGPIGPYGPLGQWGPVGENLFNPSQFLDLLGPWGDWAKILTDVGGPLSADGPLGHRGPVARDYWRELLDSSSFIRQEFVDHLEPGGLLSVSGPIGPLGALGPLGPLGPVGAHGYTANDDGQWIPEDGECKHSDEKDVCRTVVVSFDGEESREYELFENYDEDFAQRMDDNDTSFMVQGTIPSPDEEVDVYEFTSNETQMVTLLVFGQESRNEITSSAVPLIMQAGAATLYHIPPFVFFVPYDHANTFDDFDIRLTIDDGEEVRQVSSISSEMSDWISVLVPAGAELTAEVHLASTWRTSLRDEEPNYRLFVVGGTQHWTSFKTKGDHQATPGIVD